MDPSNSGIALKQIPDLPTMIMVVGYFLAAWIISLLVNLLIRKVLTLGKLAPKERRPSVERTHTLQTLITSLISFFFFIVAVIVSLSMFISSSTLIWIFGLFSAAFGFGARLVVSDVLAGIGFIFSETFDIGEKVEFILTGINTQGVIEQVNLTTTIVRAPTGEQFTIPNGEIRVVRNFSRGKYSMVNITLYVAPQHLQHVLEIIRPLGNESFNEIPDQIEPWSVISGSNLSASKVELTVIAKATLGHGADLKLRLINLIQDRLKKEDIHLLD